ncbi:MAG: hypothetical protein EX258_06940 [Sphingomonadaceae bacterium]|nr:MAG: hypothetical protein EX258_06940 [Sphingomonadaceae bacterium]
MFLSAFLLMAAPPATAAASQPAPAPSPIAATARGRASVKIVRSYRLEAGREEQAQGGQWRSATITDRAGRHQPARLMEFE